jgi:L-fuconate dehydratase
LKIADMIVHDLRFPTSLSLDGSDAMNGAPDYSAAYVILKTGTPELDGHGFTFTIGRGNEICITAIEALRPLVIGRSLDDIAANMGQFWRQLAGDSQLRWIGPEKGAVHLALAAVTNAIWDLWAKQQGKPVWQLVAEMTPEDIVALIDFRHISDALSPDQALGILRAREAGKAERLATLMQRGVPAYTTSAGWLGYSDDKIRALCRAAIAEGWDAIKIKVGRNLDDDLRRCAIVREELGPDRRMMIDANQVWEIDQAIDWVTALARFDPYWIEEPVSPDDILGHRKIADAVRPIRVASGEHAHNRIMFKQFLQADALDVVQLDNCRLGGLNEVLAVLLMAAKFGKPVCPHAGGVGLCEYGQHVSIIDYLCIAGSFEDRMLEHAGQLHEHFVSPITISQGHYRVPIEPGFSAEIKARSIEAYRFPNGSQWQEAAA